MKIAIVSGASKQGDSIRGIGAHNSELFKAFNKGSNKNINIPEVSRNDDLSKYDTVHFTVFRPFFISLPFFKPKNTKFILTIHDLIPLVYPDVYRPGIKGTIKFLINKFLVWKNIDAIITISETSKKDICRFLGVDPKKVHVVYLGSKESHKKLSSGKWEREVTAKYKLPGKFVFYFGDINYNKNLPTLIKACKKVDIPLVIGGKQALEVEKMDLYHPENVHLKSIFNDLLESKDVVRLGFVSDEDANKILNLAVCLVQPSFYEGFGLSIIHAFASGCPVISSKTQALVEIGGDAAVYFDPRNVDDLSQKIKKFVKDDKSRKEYIKKGFERVKSFTWEKTAQETLDVYAKV